MQRKLLKAIVGTSTLFFSSILLANTNATPFQQHPFYIGAEAGIFQATFQANYLDQTDVIQQNISETIQQRGYTEGLLFGFSKLFCNQYLLGGEISGHLDSHQVTFQSGASTTAFSDTMNIRNHVDVSFVPGLLLNNTTAAYLKLGVSFASVRDTLTSPVGFTPTNTAFNSNKNANGFAGGLGVKKFLTERVAVFAEGNYHDYGKVSFSDFQNFSANYSHSAHIYSYDVQLGLAIHF